MSKENLEQFMNQLAGSEELQAKIGEEIDAASLITLGAECGCEFTADDLIGSFRLSDEELDAVSGGRQTEGTSQLRLMGQFGRNVEFAIKLPVIVSSSKAHGIGGWGSENDGD